MAVVTTASTTPTTTRHTTHRRRRRRASRSAAHHDSPGTAARRRRTGARPSASSTASTSSARGWNASALSASNSERRRCVAVELEAVGDAAAGEQVGARRCAARAGAARAARSGACPPRRSAPRSRPTPSTRSGGSSVDLDRVVPGLVGVEPEACVAPRRIVHAAQLPAGRAATRCTAPTVARRHRLRHQDHHVAGAAVGLAADRRGRRPA